MVLAPVEAGPSLDPAEAAAAAAASRAAASLRFRSSAACCSSSLSREANAEYHIFQWRFLSSQMTQGSPTPPRSHAKVGLNTDVRVCRVNTGSSAEMAYPMALIRPVRSGVPPDAS